jgi:actin-related protein
MLISHGRYLLIDSRPRRMVLAIPSALPLPLLSTVLDTIFTSFQSPTISLMSAPVLTTVAAGLRSALIVDIGWAETVVTGVYEYREVESHRSVRAMKMLGEATNQMLGERIAPHLFGEHANESEDDRRRREEGILKLVSFEECEEVLARVVWCKSGKASQPEDTHLAPVKEEDELGASTRSFYPGQEGDPMISIPLSSTNPPRTLRIPFSSLAEPCETTFFAPDIPERELDDEETPLHLLVYRSLLHLPVDVRTMCMSRIIFVGGGSRIPGLRRRVLDEVASLTKQRDWDPVKGKGVEAYLNNSKLQRIRISQRGPTEVLPDGTTAIPAGLQKQEPDPIEAQLKREARKAPPVECGHLRTVESLGAWSGASLLSQLKIPAISIVDRDQWLQHGVSGASRPSEISVTTQRQSMGPGAFKTAAGDRSSWTLGLWG